MTLEEAISNNTGLVVHAGPMLRQVDIESIRLGIEALKAVVLERELYAFERIDTLPSETEE